MWRRGGVLVVLLCSGAVGAAPPVSPRTTVVVFPFAARAEEQRIFGHSLARAVGKSLEGGERLKVIVAPQRPRGDDPTRAAAAARELHADLAVVGTIAPTSGNEVQLGATVIDAAGGAAAGPPAEVRAGLERLDEGAGALGRALRPQLEAWRRSTRAVAPDARPGAVLVYGVAASVGAEGDVRVPATRSAYVFVHRHLGLRPQPDATYGFVPVTTAAAAATGAGCRGALMLRIERLVAGGVGRQAEARLALRVVAAGGRPWRERTVTVAVEHRPGERRAGLAKRAVMAALQQAMPEILAVLGPIPTTPR